MKNIIKIILWILLLIYVLIVLSLCIFILNQNSYGITEFNNKSFVIVNEKNKYGNYKDGDLVVVRRKDFNSLEIDDEIFIYKSDEKNYIYVHIDKIKNINKVNKDVTLFSDEQDYNDEFILGVSENKIEHLGGIIEFLEGKWAFFTLIILPCSFLAIYEVYYIFKYLLFGEKKVL